MKLTSLTDIQLAQFKRDGFLLIRNMFTAEEVRVISDWTDQVIAYPQVPGKVMMYSEDSLTEPGHRIVSRIENFYPFHADFAKLLDGDKLRGLAGELLGEDAVLFKDKINFKMPGGNGFTPHQDTQAGWDKYASLHLTALVSIDACTIENGCLEIAGGYHDKGLIGESWAPLGDRQIAGMQFIPYVTQPGDAIFFDSFVPHRSAPNLTDKQRRVLYVTYNKTSEGDHRAQYYQDKRKSYPPDCERDPDKRYVFRV